MEQFLSETESIKKIVFWVFKEGHHLPRQGQTKTPVHSVQLGLWIFWSLAQEENDLLQILKWMTPANFF